MRYGFKSKWWGTFNQVRQNNSVVRRGQKGTYIILWKPISRKRVNEDGKEIDESFLIMREFVVFNVEQTTGLPQFEVGFCKAKETPVERYEEADDVIGSTGARIEYGGNQPCYRPHDDRIQMPFRHQFSTVEAFYETTCHELVHWTQHKDRVGRKEDHQYAFGELVAEIGACFLMSELGLPTGDTLSNSASYVQGWLKAMSNDTRFIFSASAQASKAADFVLSFSRSPADEPEAVPF
jgi:antirestriction protein ArdC